MKRTQLSQTSQSSKSNSSALEPDATLAQSEVVDMRLRIIERANEMFRVGLYSMVTTEQIALSLGISKKTIYRHFKSKEEILLGVLEYITNTINTTVDSIIHNSSCDFVSRVISYLDYMKVMHKESAPKSVVLDIQRSAPAVWNKLQLLLSARKNVIVQFLAEGVKEQSIRQHPNLDLITIIYLSSVMNFMDERTLKHLQLTSGEFYQIFGSVFYAGLMSASARQIQIEPDKLAYWMSRMQASCPMKQRLEYNDEDREVSKERIVHASMHLFFNYGFSRVTMDELAHELGISKKTLYKYFESKEDILRSVYRSIENRADCMHSAMIFNSVEEFVYSMHAFMEMMSQTIRTMGQQFSRDLQRNAPGMWGELQQWRSNTIDRSFTSIIAEGIRCGAIQTSYKPEHIAQVYRVIVDSVLNPDTLSSTPYSSEDYYRNIFDLVFYGIMTDSAREQFITKQFMPASESSISNYHTLAKLVDDDTSTSNDKQSKTTANKKDSTKRGVKDATTH
jgi:AcrR family transcriptional regulator